MERSIARLIVGTDFSESSAAALLEARSLASWSGARVDIVHVTTLPDESWRGDPATDVWLRAVGLEPADLVILSGHAWVELVRHVEAIAATALIVGTHGRSGYQPIRLGSTAAKLATASPCPVLVVSPRHAGRASPHLLRTAST